jgi:hypothetical protein
MALEYTSIDSPPWGIGTNWHISCENYYTLYKVDDGLKCKTIKSIILF